MQYDDIADNIGKPVVIRFFSILLKGRFSNPNLDRHPLIYLFNIDEILYSMDSNFNVNQTNIIISKNMISGGIVELISFYEDFTERDLKKVKLEFKLRGEKPWVKHV